MLKNKSYQQITYLFVGLGSIGQRHLKNLRSMTNARILAYRSSKRSNKSIEDKYNIDSFSNLETALAKYPDVVFITNPTSLHIPTALKAAKNKCHLFIEKPISHNTDNIDKLFSICKHNNKVCYVGYNYRFHPNLLKIKQFIDEKIIGKIYFARIQVGQYLPDWHPNKDYRKEYSAIEELGGGVVLTLTHEVDYIHWLFGEIDSLISFTKKVSQLEINVEDIAAIILETKDNIVIELHMDYLQRPSSRTCEIVGENGKILWDYFKNEIKLFVGKENKWYVFREDNFQRNDMYKNELIHFHACIDDKEQPVVSVDQVKAVMDIVKAIKLSSLKGKKIFIESVSNVYN